MEREMVDPKAIEADARMIDEIKQVIATLDAIATAPYPIPDFGDGYKQVGVNFSLKACEIAAKITGADATFCKMLNHQFRTDAANWMFDRALEEVA